MRSILVLVFLLTALAAGSEFVVVPHIASDTESFQTQLVLENRSNAERVITLLAYADSEVIGSQAFTLASGMRQSYTMEQLFPGLAVTHMIVDKHEGLFAGVEYIPMSNPENRTYVEGIREFSQRWRIYPSNWESTFDGLILVGSGCYNAEISIAQYTAAGEYLARVQLEPGPLIGFGKLVFNLSQLLQPVEGSYVEVEASHPIAALALKGSLTGSLGSAFLVGNQAQAYPTFENLRALIRANRGKWQKAGLANDYQFKMENQCFCTYNRAANVTVRAGRLEKLTYSDDGANVDLHNSRRYLTIDEQFEMLEDALAMGVDQLEVNFHETLGSPNSIYINWSGCTSDEETSILVTEIEPLPQAN